MDQGKLDRAANRLEELTIIQKEAVKNLRLGAPDAYAQVYWIRREMSKIVGSLGFGIPADLKKLDHDFGPPSSWEL